ncbi:carbamoyltransferase HypF [Sulfurihydrogenibium sp.]|uniref:carbamoyltransferase HypF n=1 Tax=Sulfurihydrogenibium sp. TaxID=2053621 RepID=UPI002614DD8E|nr:carbamoyltransferase HypF [Sulfurihydrogenibium sp.]
MIKRAIVRFTGAVQGVGFRPFVYKLANRYGLKGFVLNDGKGVVIEVEGEEEVIKDFILSIHKEKPTLANIFSQSVEIFENLKNYKEFKILESVNTMEKEVFILPDISTCDDCLKELFNPKDRRYLYPFTNCTNCGPRFSITEKLPYDRKNTTMKSFHMCKDCLEEYNDPSNRRFHAQPNACPVCGPNIFLHTKDRKLIAKSIKAIEFLKDFILNGDIVAVKGIGGFHLVCDATNDKAVNLLRERKKRFEKPFAVMFKDIDQIKNYTLVSYVEEITILSSEKPIVIVKKKENTDLSELIAPDLDKIGVFLPYSPLHHILFKFVNKPLVMTSANVSEEPIVKDNDEAFEKLSYFTDYILTHNRDIKNRVDDSVVFCVKDKTFFIRRSRGYAPLPVKLPFKLKSKVLAVGGHQKVTIALGIDDKAYISQHIGDLETLASQETFEETIYTFFNIYNFYPDIIVSDLHPNYYSTKWAKNFSMKNGVKHIQVQHHYAHGLSLMADNHIKEEKILTVCWDGTGYGLDGNLWGGEFLIVDYENFERVFHFDYFKLIGGEKAVKEPRRVALSILFKILGKDSLNLNLPTLNEFSENEISSLYTIWEKNINTPLSSSVGRLFDAVSSLLGIKQVLSYEGQSGMIMEGLYDYTVKDFYSFDLKNGKIVYDSLFIDLIQDKSDTRIKVSRFINTLVKIILDVSKNFELKVGFSGGVFQNKVLLTLLMNNDKNKSFLYHRSVPPNDGGIALGQVVFNQF